MRPFAAYVGVVEILRAYWRLYGGWIALAKSPYLHLAVVLTIVTSHSWTTEGWWNDPLTVLPNLIGFTLSGYALLITLGDEEFRTATIGRLADGKDSPFLGLNSTFVHFLMLQISAVLLALVAKSRPITSLMALVDPAFPDCIIEGDDQCAFSLSNLRFYAGRAFWFFGYFMFIYALVLTIAAVLNVFRVARAYDEAKSDPSNTPSRS